MNDHRNALPVKEIAKPVAVSLYPSDVESVEIIRRHFDLDSFSQVIRRSIRLTAKQIESETAPVAEPSAA